MKPLDSAAPSGPDVAARWEPWVDALVLGGVLAAVGTALRPDLLLTPTTPSGGDIPSHYATAVYLRDHLLPRGQISGWTQGNYAGFPILQFYFPLSFLLMMGLSLFVPLPVAFKLVSVLGILSLPLAMYALVRLLGLRFPTPALAAVSSIPFLFQEGNSMWGGNVMSTLAGEFAFGLGFTLAVLFLGTAWVGIQTGRGAVLNAVLLALVGLAHGYPLLLAGLTTLVLPAMLRDRWAGLRYLLTVYGLAFCLLSVWILPLLANLPYTTAFAPAWFIKSWTEVLPRDFWPFALAAAAWVGWLCLRRLWRGAAIDRASLYLLYGLGISGTGYLMGPWLGVVDVRFIPFGQVLLTLLGTVGFGALVRLVRFGPALGLMIVAGLAGWSLAEAKQIPHWVAWNYAGAEQTSLWPAFLGVNRLVAGDANDPRVVYEHSMVHNGAGSPRAFETLPLHSGRSTLEGLYLQASPTAPMVFYVQAELSKEASCPFTHVACTHFNVSDALRHLRLFNVREIIAVSDQLKEALRRRRDVERLASVPPYDVYRIKEEDQSGYVVPLKVEPLLVRTDRWKDVAYQWFRLVHQLDVPLVFPTGARGEQLDRFATVTPTQLVNLPRRPLALPDSGPVRTKLSDDTILFETPYVGHPHLIRVSYHPNWHVEGADRIYLAAPSFMLVYPGTRQVRLWYGPSWPDRLGAVLTGVAILGPGAWRLARRARRERPAPASPAPALQWLGTAFGRIAAGLPLVLLTVALVLAWIYPSPYVLLNEGIQARDRRDFDAATRLLQQVLDRAPSSGAAEQAAYYLATVSYLREDMEGTIAQFEAMLRAYPTSPFVPEGWYHIGLAHLRLNRPDQAREALQKVIEAFPESAWAKYAGDRLGELKASGRL